MRDDVATQRYLSHYIEPGLPDPPACASAWRHVLIIPAYDETPQLLQQLQRLHHGQDRCLIVLVLNHPDNAPTATLNAPLRRAVAAQYRRICANPNADVFNLGDHTDLCLLDVDALRGPLPAAQGVGLARKIGCDLAFKWIAAGAIDSNWLHCSDADASLPHDYFARTVALANDTVGATYPFVHRSGERDRINRATALYELRVHHYVLGLEYAGSPYAMHTLGSCLAVRVAAYAHCRGFPRRAGAEDFYLLNKLVKLGSVARLQGSCIELTSRTSTRVPFGTGPAVATLSDSLSLAQTPCFYHPASFAVLKRVLQLFPRLANDTSRPLATLLADTGLDTGTAQTAQRALCALGWDKALQHCQRQSGSEAQFLRYLHEWLDALRTLQFLHVLRDDALPARSLRQLAACEPPLWPATATQTDADDGETVEALRAAVRAHWHWDA